MDKKKILLLVGGVAVIVIVAVVTQYMMIRDVTTSNVVMLQNSTGEKMDEQSSDQEQDNQVTFSADSYSGIIQSADEKNIVILKEDGNTETYESPSIYMFYDNRADEMKSIEQNNLEKGASVQVSVSMDNKGDVKKTSITMYNK